MKEYKESYLGFVLWLLFCISSTVLVAIFTKNSSTHISITALNTTKNLNLILLFLLMYKMESAYWLNGVSFEKSKNSTSEQRLDYIKKHIIIVIYYAIFSFLFSMVSLFLNLNYVIDIIVDFTSLFIAVLISLKIKL